MSPGEHRDPSGAARASGRRPDARHSTLVPAPYRPEGAWSRRCCRADHPDGRAATARRISVKSGGRGTCGWDRRTSPRHGLGQPPPRRLRDGDLGRRRTALFVFLDVDGDGPVETSIETGPDYVFVPPFVPHCEVNPDPGTEAVVVIARTTQEAIVVNRRATRLGAGRPVHARGPRDPPLARERTGQLGRRTSRPGRSSRCSLDRGASDSPCLHRRARPEQVFTAHDRARPRLLRC